MRVLAETLAGIFLLALFGCYQGSEDRYPLVVDSASVARLEILPTGSRYILQDSATAIVFGGFRLGYACTRIRALELNRQTASPITYGPILTLELPGNAECPLDSSVRDSIIAYRFTPSDRPRLYLVNAGQAITDSAQVVQGRIHFDSLVFAAGNILRPPSDTRFKLDSSLLEGRGILYDSLAGCEVMNQADFIQRGDTLSLRFSYIHLDSSAHPDSCIRELHSGFLPMRQGRP